MKGDMLELMMVYQDIQDKLYDIDRSWQNSLVFHNVKQVTDIGWFQLYFIMTHSRTALVSAVTRVQSALR